jgi:SAM-dependent methyltransferase
MRIPEKLDPRSLLRHSIVYNFHSRIMAPDARKRRFVDEILKPRRGERVLDIGCGTASLLEFMPDVSYVGFDLSNDYVEAARASYGDRAQFFHYALTEDAVGDFEPFDLAMAIGVIHHLDNREAGMLFRVAYRALKPGGRLVTCDGAYVAGQSRFARLLLDLDRGQHVRSPQSYEALASSTFVEIERAVYHDLNAFPYTHCVMTCRRTA